MGKSIFSRAGAAVALLLLIAALSFTALPGMVRFARNESARQAEAISQSIRRTLAHCYALEGAYPPSLEYLKRHYGLMLDSERYFYHYEFVGANIPPNVWVVPR